MDGLSLLLGAAGWLFGGSFLYVCVLAANSMHAKPTEDDEWCADIDLVVQMQDAHDARMRREARV